MLHFIGQFVLVAAATVILLWVLIGLPAIVIMTARNAAHRRAWERRKAGVLIEPLPWGKAVLFACFLTAALMAVFAFH